jgi:hypothetical protein
MFRTLSMVALLLIGASCSLEDPEAGKGTIVLSPGVRASLEEYMGLEAPLYFAVTEDGRGSSYIYCSGGFNCDRSASRRQTLDNCASRNAGRACKLYAIRRVVVWQDADGRSGRTGPELSAAEQLTRDCLHGATPAIRIERCSQAIASSELAQEQKRGPFYVRARAYELLGELGSAEKDYRAVLEIDPNQVEARARLNRLTAHRPEPVVQSQ